MMEKKQNNTEGLFFAQMSIILNNKILTLKADKITFPSKEIIS